MTTLQQLLAFRHDALVQFVLVSSIFGAFAMSGVIALLTGQERSRLREVLFIVLSGASLAFIFATLLGVMLLPATANAGQLSEAKTRSLLGLYSVAVWAIILGTALLTAALALMGFLVSSRAGKITAVCTSVAAAGFIWTVIEFARAMRQ